MSKALKIRPRPHFRSRFHPRFRPFLTPLLLFSLLVGCAVTKTPAGDRAEFEAYVAELDEKRQDQLYWTMKEKTGLSIYAPNFEDQAGEFDQEELDRLIMGNGSRGDEEGEPEYITGKEAVEDADAFFRLLQTTYGGYYYFGGDDVFLPIRDAVVSQLEGTDTISPEELASLLAENLADIIADAHFIIGSHQFIEQREQFMYYVPELYLDDAAGLDPAYVRPSVGPHGELTHCFAALSHDGTDLPGEVEIAGKKRSLKWERAGTYDLPKDQEKTGYRKTEASGIPVLESRILYALSGETQTQSQLNALSGAGKEYAGLPALIVDLRHNEGGDSGYAMGWVEGFAGRTPQPKVAYFEKCSDPYLRSIEIAPAYAESDPLWKEGYLEKRGRFHWGFQDGLSLENDTVVFLLTDKNTASSGEDFVRYLSTANRVIRVGSNTAGCLQFGNVCEFFLPNSGLFLRMGSKLSFYGGTELTEGVGVEPDLWVDPTQALDAAVRMCEYYNIK